MQDTGDPVCDLPSHAQWYRAWHSRFGRQAFHAVCNRQEEAEVLAKLPPGPNGEPGVDVRHTFIARKVWCLETMQWACGYPIAWTKCYDAEGDSQVLGLINHAFPYPSTAAARPQFVAFDKACALLRHIGHQNIQDPWLTTSRFIVDSWHYINHRADDELCRKRCNPAPANGSQPDLVHVTRHEDGTVTRHRAYNLETAEQFNSWLNSFTPFLSQMTDVNYDFHVYVLMLIYRDRINKRIAKKGQGLEVAEDI